MATKTHFKFSFGLPHWVWGREEEEDERKLVFFACIGSISAQISFQEGKKKKKREVV